MIEIKIHGRGGQGNVAAVELLTMAAFKDGEFAQAFPSFKEVCEEFTKAIGRVSGGLIKTYNLEGADPVIICIGSLAGTIKDLITAPCIL
jgi:pyruvate/2-oxoacid:ferredoxin oxidoreductase alpha subunit